MTRKVPDLNHCPPGWSRELEEDLVMLLRVRDAMYRGVQPPYNRPT